MLARALDSWDYQQSTKFIGAVLQGGRKVLKDTLILASAICFLYSICIQRVTFGPSFRIFLATLVLFDRGVGRCASLLKLVLLTREERSMGARERLSLPSVMLLTFRSPRAIQSREDWESLTICKCQNEGSKLSSVILRPWVLVREFSCGICNKIVKCSWQNPRNVSKL